VNKEEACKLYQKLYKILVNNSNETWSIEKTNLRFESEYTGLHINKYGTIQIYNKSKLHCLDGPAIIGEDGYNEFHINGIHYFYTNFFRQPEVIKHQAKKLLNSILSF